MLNNKTILITGGTGFLGKNLTKTIAEKYPNVKKIIIYSRDEQKQFEMAEEYPKDKYPFIRFVIGDVRDEKRLMQVMQEVDYVIHSAAMKHVHIAEYNPQECIKTNIGGAENVINACLKTNVKKVVALSTDKACSPTGIYGATKLASDKLFVAANNIKGKSDITFSVVRYGNVIGANGSVVPYFLKKKQEGILPITDPEMTRFSISLEEGINMILHALEYSWGGEIFVPKIPSFKILDMAKAIAPEAEYKIVGIRPGEKVHEEMINSSDSFHTYDLDKYYTILPDFPILDWTLQDYINHFKAVKVKDGFEYNSKDNSNWISVKKLKKLVQNIEL